MKKLAPLWGAGIGLLLAIPLTAVTYLINQLTAWPFPPFTLFDWFSRILPGDILTFGIDLMIDSLRLLGGAEAVSNAKTAEQLMAVSMFLTGSAIAGAIFFLLMRLIGKSNWLIGIAAGILFAAPLVWMNRQVNGDRYSLILVVGWFGAAFIVWGIALSWVFRRLWGMETAVSAPETSSDDTRTVERIDRRKFLIRLGASTAGITVVGGGISAFLAQQERQQQAAQLAARGALTTNITSFPNDNDPVIPAPGTRAEYTPIEDHYSVFLRTEPSIIEEADWILPITGMVDNPQMLTLANIRNNYPAHSQFVTLSCISGRIGTTLISTTEWTGVSAQDLLADVGIHPDAKYLDITSEDGFHESVALELINNDPRIMFCYDWDGQPLPKDHGFPLRIWIPDRYGMKQPKWITGIEVTDEYRQGYWVERNWSETAQVKTTSVIDTVAVDNIIEKGLQHLVPIGGIAWAGDRQISKVEVRVDGGDWQEADLRTPLSETTWVIWRYDWPFVDG
ncbi:MAG: molybdopterin-dependent oxidoreductase, partial [Anaerolineales bacterium]|nr:molybdopterin-dependent oxidoreductase [Anaerolineales bacterium]